MISTVVDRGVLTFEILNDVPFGHSFCMVFGSPSRNDGTIPLIEQCFPYGRFPCFTLSQNFFAIGGHGPRTRDPNLPS